MFEFLKKKEIITKEEVATKAPHGFFSTDTSYSFTNNIKEALDNSISKSIQVNANSHVASGSSGMDSNIIKNAQSLGTSSANVSQLMWYASQGFIGYQACAIIAQHWLVNKACSLPAKDAIRKGWEITVNDGSEVKGSDIEFLKKLDKEFKIKEQLHNFVKFGRVFGIRIAMFKIKGFTNEDYEKPFNIDGIKQNSYEGIVQIDPIWITPLLTSENASNPTSLHFYEPTYWQVSGMKIHKSHLVIMKTEEVSDILKPTYLYGGLSVPQKIMERVYAAERSANEAPLLLMTKRLNILKINTEEAMTDMGKFIDKLNEQIMYRDNYGVNVIGDEEEVQQLETTLSDVDAVIGSQYELVSAITNIPIYKLLGKSLKGFSGGETEESSYHEELENIQDYDMTPLLDRHYQLLIKSELKQDFEITINWNPLDAVTEKEQAEINKTKADTDAIYVNSGIIGQNEVREKLINNADSGYNGLEMIEELEPLENEETI
jgi:uncharacterized protein